MIRNKLTKFHPGVIKLQKPRATHSSRATMLFPPATAVTAVDIVEPVERHRALALHPCLYRGWGEYSPPIGRKLCQTVDLLIAISGFQQIDPACRWTFIFSTVASEGECCYNRETVSFPPVPHRQGPWLPHAGPRS